ncbi:MAG: hypothetical protein AB1529_03110 [Candidatus Micrarchaeota archaeon]
MPHTYTFNPPLRPPRSSKGPLLRLGERLQDPMLEQALKSSRLDAAAICPYKGGDEVARLVDHAAPGAMPAGPDDAMLVISLGLPLMREGGAAMIRAARTHVHQTRKPMRPEVLLAHSKEESGPRIITVSVMEESSLLAAAMLREFGHPAYLSTVEAPDGSKFSALAVMGGSGVSSFTVHGAHPGMSGLTIFEDPEVLCFLSLLRAGNEARKLLRDIDAGEARESDAQERYGAIISDLALGCASGHYLSGPMEEAVAALADMYPALRPVQKQFLS